MSVHMPINIESFSDKDLRKYIDSIINIITNGINDTKKVIFICGKDKSDKESFRFKISQLLEQKTNYQLAYPEDLFEDLLEGQASNSLLSLEQQLAEAVDLIILIPESPGSFAELGAFSTQKELAEKMLVLRPKKYKSDKSFINHGPIRLVRSYKGKILDIQSKFDNQKIEHTSSILKTVKKMIPSGRKSKSINNILLYQNHILLLIYLFDSLSMNAIHKLMALILSKRKLTNQEVIGCKAAIHSLIRSLFIEKIGDEFSITSRGFLDIQNKYYALNEISSLRVSIMNKQLSP
ncbi:UDP-3-O-(3-hydroxymyristoyl)glucosamine N-acyltransferase [Enterobacter cloacae]|uniref:UDP-3-O-(3-hydroxymyristoyl)glucosamine N-acyltransferase n=2 Tax=Enterobacter TaxID=547 RepID=A0A7H8UNY7_ENTCL|nr:UDP-3-O-(3-hydroxymyristoyl)glucosamine N-acyltransferase [Enterobacter cloacae]